MSGSATLLVVLVIIAIVAAAVAIRLLPVLIHITEALPR